MLLLLLIYVVLRALWKIDVYLISTLVNKSLYYLLYDLFWQLVNDFRVITLNNDIFDKSGCYFNTEWMFRDS